MAKPIDAVKLNAARLVAADLQPFLSMALYSLHVVPAPGLGTFAVDEKWRLYVDPTVLLRWSTPHVAGVLLHEVGHVIRDHGARARAVFVQESDRHRWNVAADAEINDDLVTEGVQLPPVPVLPHGLGLKPGLAAEFYFHALLSRSSLPKDPGCGPGATGNESQLADLERRFASGHRRLDPRTGG
jgi:Putative metallopeptidase domain